MATISSPRRKTAPVSLGSSISTVSGETMVGEINLLHAISLFMQTSLDNTDRRKIKAPRDENFASGQISALSDYDHWDSVNPKEGQKHTLFWKCGHTSRGSFFGKSVPLRGRVKSVKVTYGGKAGAEAQMISKKALATSLTVS